MRNRRLVFPSVYPLDRKRLPPGCVLDYDWQGYRKTSLSTHVRDHSGRNHHVVSVAKPTRVTVPVGGAVEFNGGNNYADIDGAPGTGTIEELILAPAFTLSAWVRPTTLGVVNYVFDFSGTLAAAGAGMRFLLWSTDAIGILLGATLTVSSVKIGTAAGSWCHLTAVYDSTLVSELKFYENGVKLGTDISNDGGPFEIDTVVLCRMGRSSDAWTGDMGRIAFFDRALTAEEVRNVYRLDAWRVKLAA